MKKSYIITLVVVVVVLVVAGIFFWMNSSMNNMPMYPATNVAATPGSGTPTVPSTTSTSTPGTPAPSQPQTLLINTMTNATLGQYLVATNGMTLYTYNKDTSGKSNCTGSCATFWPPYTVSTGAVLGAGPNIMGAIALLARADGTSQVTYNGMPLYFWSSDKVSGDVTGNGVNGFAVAKP